MERSVAVKQSATFNKVAGMQVELNETEIRVLGVLIEKSLTHPESYPLTLNTIVLGASQKQNRDPVLEYTEAQVASALQSLMDKELARQSPPALGARANRFEHSVVERWHWDRRDQAVMAELMLRARQTAGEIRTRATRMTPLNDLEAAMSVLRELARRDPPFLEELPREPGRSANRFRHLLMARSADPASGVISGTVLAASTEKEPPRTPSALADLSDRVSRLEAQVARLTAEAEPMPLKESRGIDETEPGCV